MMCLSNCTVHWIHGRVQKMCQNCHAFCVRHCRECVRHSKVPRLNCDMSQKMRHVAKNRRDKKTCRNKSQRHETCRNKSQGHVAKSQGHVAKSQFFETCLCDLATCRKESQKIAIICDMSQLQLLYPLRQLSSPFAMPIAGTSGIGGR